MTTEENKRMLALSYIAADLKAENIEMTQRVHQLMDDYNDAVRQQHGLEARKDENSSKLTLGEMMKMRDHCDELERTENLSSLCISSRMITTMSLTSWAVRRSASQGSRLLRCSRCATIATSWKERTKY